jgi:choline dehydrogenase-like flavoprotein
LEGRSAQVAAKTYVLACGGIENARLLLFWTQTAPAGLGGRSDLIGRYFMEHPHSLMAIAVTDQPFERFFCYLRGTGVTVEGREVFAKPGVSVPMQQREKLLNGCVDIYGGGERSEGYVIFTREVKTILRGEFPDDLGGAFLTILGDLDGLFTGAYRKVAGQNVLWCATNSEQVPNPDSRVLLKQDRDALGVPRIRLEWRLTEQDKRSIRRVAQIFGEELARLEVARMRLDPWLVEDDTTWVGLVGRDHHIGTTRMHDDPKQGVVDRNCRMHGVANFYIAGSSVFPTSGYTQPTLTLIALALRLADHLKRAWPPGAAAASSNG